MNNLNLVIQFDLEISGTCMHVYLTPDFRVCSFHPWTRFDPGLHDRLWYKNEISFQNEISIWIEKQNELIFGISFLIMWRDTYKSLGMEWTRSRMKVIPESCKQCALSRWLKTRFQSLVGHLPTLVPETEKTWMAGRWGCRPFTSVTLVQSLDYLVAVICEQSLFSVACLLAIFRGAIAPCPKTLRPGYPQSLQNSINFTTPTQTHTKMPDTLQIKNVQPLLWKSKTIFIQNTM